MRVAVLRGKVKDGNNAALPKVKVTILNHPEFGQTLTRADGAFDMAVNGGGLLTLKFEKVGLMPAQRQLMTPWQDYVIDEDVVMLPYDDRVTSVDLSANTPIQVVTGNSVTDSSGSRRNVLMFKQGTSAVMTLPGGSTQSLSLLHVRSTEYTAGPLGLAAMPGDLPATSAFTYASEFSLDEAVGSGATAVSFSQPVAQYNENFLNFPVGTVIPSGSYDKTTGIWMPSTNGLVVKILSVSSGAANLDIDGSGNPASDASLTALGINAAERQQLATLFSVGQTLWRVPLNHFSAWDSNFGFGPPGSGGPPNGGSASGGSGGPNPPDPCGGCIIGMQDQSLSEEVSLVGTKFFLRYDSTRPRGNINNFTARIPLSGATLPGPVKRIEVTLSIAGQTQQLTFPAQPNQSTAFTWDGRDAYGRTVQGQQELSIDIGNVYDGVYVQTPAFGYNGNGVPITVNTRREITIHRKQKVLLGTYAAPPQSLGGWSLSVNHVYDPVGQTLYEGNGKRRDVQTVSNGIDTFAGGLSGFQGDGGPVSGARFRWPYGLDVGPDNSIYVADSGNQRVRKIAPNGIVTTFAGNGGGCNPFNFPCGDGGPAANASFGSVNRVAIGSNGTVYIGGGRNLWSVTPDGIFHRLAGLALDGFSGDGGPAVDAQISNATRFYPAADGSVYLSDILNQRIRRIDPNGIITTIAGTGTAGFGGDGGPATQAQINYPGDIVAAPDGSVYFIDQDNNRIRRISPDGIISTYAGTGTFGSSPDGLPALQTNFIFRAANPIEAGSMSLGPDGSLYVVSYVFPAGGRVRRIGPDGIVTGVAGNGQLGAQGDGGPALQSQMRLAAIGLGPDGSVYAVGGFTFDFDESRIRKISPPLPAFDGTNIAIPSEDGAELFRFDANGRHLSTINTLTTATIYAFAYDSAGRLTTVTDGDNNITTIERDGSGNPTGIRSTYNQLTSFTRNVDGYLATITNPANEQYQFTYNVGGQILTERDPRNNQNTFTYDSMGRLTRDDDPAGGFQTLARTDAGVDFTVTRNTALNRPTSFQIQNLSNGDRRRVNTFAAGTAASLIEGANGVRTFTDPDGTITETTFGGDPRFKFQAPIMAKTTITTPGGFNFNATLTSTAVLSNPADLLSLTTQTETQNVNSRIYTRVFTAANRTFTRTSPLNRTATETIDTQGRATQVQFADLSAANYTYDSRGRLSVAAFGSGGTARTFTLAYNPAGFLSSLADPLNQTTSLIRDLTGRVTQRTLPDNRIIAFGYDANHNVTSMTPPGRPAHTFTYTPLNLVASYTAPAVSGNSTTTYTYNLDRHITQITRPDALQINYAYDSAGRLQTRTVPNGNYSFAYSPTTGLIQSVTAPGGGGVAFEYDGFLPKRQTWTGTVAGNVSQTYNNNLRIASQSVNGGNTINFTYDNDNMLSTAGSLTLAHNTQNGLLSGSTLINVTDTRTYNSFAETTNYNAKFNSTTLYNVDYTYDKLGRITQKIETIGGVTTTYAYAYDVTGRLTSVTPNGGPPSATYSYDSNDNRSVANFGGPPINGTYDAQDRLTQYGNTTYTYTANGELQSKTIAASTTQYGYDVMGNLRTVTLPSTTQIEYLIDGQNRRIGKKVNGTLTQGFLYQDQLEPVAELDGSNSIVSRFVYGTRSHVPDYMVKGGATYRLITDQLGSVRLAVDVATGAVAQRIDYDAFGVILSDTNPGFQPFAFAGGLYDSQTGLTRFGARDYDAETGRWTAKDPLLLGGGHTNFYVYAMSDPINVLDITGRWALRAADTEGDRNGKTKPGTILGGGMTGTGNAVEPAPPVDPNTFDPGQDFPPLPDFHDPVDPIPVTPAPLWDVPMLPPSPPNHMDPYNGGGGGNGGNGGGGNNNGGGNNGGGNNGSGNNSSGSGGSNSSGAAGSAGSGSGSSNPCP
jgi:RHS repeat-associated protein